MLKFVMISGNSGQRETQMRFAVLSNAKRQIARQKTTLSDGSEALIALRRGTVMRPFDILESSDGARVQVLAESEEVSMARAADWQTFAMACYALGCLKIPLQISSLSCAFLPNLAAERLCAHLGLEVCREFRAFMPGRVWQAGMFAKTSERASARRHHFLAWGGRRERHA
ncbi:MAG: hypothetical protein SPL30_03610 [Succinivibrio sp.]|jgi:urease accessory protein UreE|nr:hypothetical protein [Succinivibrio sp.]